MKRNHAVIIPALNPTESLIQYTRRLQFKGFSTIIIVNDGSREECNPIFSTIDQMDGCTVLTHKTNRGKGRALKTAFQHYLKHCFNLTGVITADADGQHAVEDVCKVAEAHVLHPESLVLGVRNFKEAHVPKRSYIGNTITSFAFYLLFRHKLADTQTGLRVIPTAELLNLLALKGERYEYEINMLIYAKKLKMNILEVNIQTIYYNNNAGSYYKTFKDSYKIFKRLMAGLFYFKSQYKRRLKQLTSQAGEFDE